MAAMPRRADPSPQLPTLIAMSDAERAGLNHDQARHRVRSETWLRIARGAYVTDPSSLGDLDEHSRQRVDHVHRAIAAAWRNPGTVVAYGSAAYVHQLPILGAVPQDVTLAVRPGRWTGHRSGVIFRRLELAEHHVARMRVPVTVPSRTWVDVACRGSLATALAAGDAGLRTGVLSRAALEVVAAEVGRLPGIRRVERALPLLDSIRETPLESASFAYFVESRLPLPRMQVDVSDVVGFMGRLDFLWDDVASGRRVAGESDGVLKYGDRGEAYREKRREDRLRAAGFTVVRWGFADLRTPALAARLRRILAS